MARGEQSEQRTREAGGGVAGREMEVGQERWREKDRGEADMWGPQTDM